MVATGFRKGALASVVINSVDLSVYCDDQTLTLNVAGLDTSTFGTVSWKTAIEGIADAKFDIKGDFDPTSTSGPAAALTALIGTGAHTVVLSPAGTVSLELKRTFSVIMTSYVENSPVGGLVTFTASFVATGSVVFGVN